MLVGCLQSCYAIQQINLLVTGIDPNWVKVTSRSNEPERIGLLGDGGFPINLPSSVEIYLIMIDILIFIHVSIKHYDVWNCSGQVFNNIRIANSWPLLDLERQSSMACFFIVLAKLL